MPDLSIDNALVNSYHANIQVKFQQMQSRMRPWVRVETQHALLDFYDRIGPTTAVEVTGRHTDTPLVGTEYDRRAVALRDFDWADLIDKKDKLRMLADPTSAYVVNAVMALNRAQDDVLIQAFTGNAYSGQTGQTTVALPASQTVAVNFVERGNAANSNLTIGKLRRVRYLLDKAEAANEGEADLAAMVDPSQVEALLATTEVTSSEYNTIKALVAGEIDTYMGFKFIKSNRLPISGTQRSALFWEKQGMLLAMGEEVTTDVGIRRDKRNSVQVYCNGDFGATRMWEEKCLVVLCDESQ